MAEIVDTLFGISPERYQQQQQQQADAQALAFARLDPFQQANFAVGRGANMLAGAIGGALGGRDPELQRITQRQQILGMIDPNRLESFDQAAQMALQSGDQQLAFGLRMEADKFRKTQSESAALIAQRNAAAAASTAGANKTAAEINEIERQNTVYAALTGSTPVAAAPVSVTETLLDRDGRPYTVDVGAALPNSSVRGAALPPATDAAAPVTAPRPALNQQIAALESQRAQFLALNKIPGAKAKAEVLGDQIKELRSQLKPTELTNLEREIDQFRADGVPDTDPRIKVRQDKITKLSSSNAERFGTDREAISKERFNKPFLELTQEQRKVVNQELDEKAYRTAPKVEVKNVLPGDKALVDIPAFRRAVQATIAPQLSTITAAGQALQSINDSITTGNFVSFNAARTQLARSLGDSQLSRRDIEQAGGDPSILGGLIDLTSRAITSTPSLDTQKKIQATLQAIQTVARKQATAEVEQQRRIALRSPGYNAEAVNEALKFSELQAPTAPPAAAAGAPIYARNPTTKERIMSTDGGVTWTQAR